ncbi:MAG: helix-hairpin-helix domain-containing protein [Actinomycetota bacterium]|nr:helix-hairpin-helix domain-containing protein [Actinomycetota bacterium]
MGHYAPMPRGRWVLASLVPFGWVTWAGFLYAGFRVKRPAWIAAGAAYLLVTVVTLYLTSLDDNEAGLDDNLGYIAMFSAWGVGIVHSFLSRKAYVRRLDIIDDPSLQAARTAEERRAYAHQIAQRDPALARDALIGRSGGFDEGGVVDVNHAPVEDIADLPGIDAAAARRIVAVRADVGGFSSLEDLGLTMDLPGDLVEGLRGRVVCLPR